MTFEQTLTREEEQKMNECYLNKKINKNKSEGRLLLLLLLLHWSNHLSFSIDQFSEYDRDREQRDWWVHTILRRQTVCLPCPLPLMEPNPDMINIYKNFPWKLFRRMSLQESTQSSHSSYQLHRWHDSRMLIATMIPFKKFLDKIFDACVVVPVRAGIVREGWRRMDRIWFCLQRDLFWGTRSEENSGSKHCWKFHRRVQSPQPKQRGERDRHIETVRVSEWLSECVWLTILLTWWSSKSHWSYYDKAPKIGGCE